MDRFVEQMEKGLLRELERINQLLKLVGIVLWLAGLIFAPFPWNLVIYSPFLVPPVLVLGERMLSGRRSHVRSESRPLHHVRASGERSAE